MQRALIGGAAVAVVALSAAAWLFSARSPESGAPQVERPARGRAGAPAEAQTRSPPAGGVAAPGPAAPAPAEAQPRPSAPIPPDERAKAVYTPDPDDDRALVGMGFSAVTDSERERLRVPDRFGQGVIITSLHPDAPGVEAGLEVEDVIVRARRTAVNSENDLVTAVGDRRHTVLTVSRNGQLFHVVLHKPYIPPEARPDN